MIWKSRWVILFGSTLLSLIWLWSVCLLFLLYVELLVPSGVVEEPIRLSIPTPQRDKRVRARITYYCTCKICTRGLGITATGTIPIEDNTAACDITKRGKLVKVKDKIYKCEDTGSAIHNNDIDIYVKEHETAKRNGVHYEYVEFF